MIAVQRASNATFAQLADSIRSTPLGQTLDLIRFGVDICSISEIEEALGDTGFTQRYFTEGERLHCGRFAERYAANFAIKEAVIKVLQTWPRWLTEIEVYHELSGSPCVSLSGSAREIKEALGIEYLLVSASHEGNFAIAGCLGFGRNRFYHVT